MGLKAVFVKGVEIAFSIFNEAVKNSSIIDVEDDGFDDSVVVTHENIRVICESFSMEDVETLSFSELIQPTDVKGLIPGSDLDFTLNTTTQTLKITDTSVTYAIVGFDSDPYNVLYTVLLRTV